jgi:hypothetical protein
LKKKSDVGGKDTKKEKTKSKEKEKPKKGKYGEKTEKGKEVLNYNFMVHQFSKLLFLEVSNSPSVQ